MKTVIEALGDKSKGLSELDLKTIARGVELRQDKMVTPIKKAKSTKDVSPSLL
jgi:hypothetical protein